jgi:CSLREA domain-containing protein
MIAGTAGDRMGFGARGAVLAALLLVLSLLVPQAAIAQSAEEPQGEGTTTDVRVERLFGQTRFGTARVIAAEAFGTSDTAVIASGQQFPDALAGSYLAGVFEAPVLLVAVDTATDDTLAALEALEVTDLVVLGGDAVIGDDVISTLETSYDIAERFAGATRYETAAEIATSQDDIGTWEGERTAIVATGQAFPDALVASTLAASERLPVLLTPTAALHPAARAALLELDVERVIIPGGSAAVSTETEAAIAALDIDVTRVTATGGRYDTAVALANFAIDEFGYNAGRVNIATGADFADALTLGPKAARERAPMILTDGTLAAPPAASVAFLRENACTVTALDIAGGTAAIGTENADALRAAANACEGTDPDPQPTEEPTEGPTEEPVPGRVETFDVTLSWVNETDGQGAFGLGEPGAAGTTTLTIDEDANSIAFEVDYTGVTGPFAPAPGFHVHEGGVEENGPVVVLLATGAQLEAEEDQVLSATVTPTFDVSEILDAPEEYYLNLHSTMFPAGAIRGQLPDGGQDEVPGTFFTVTSTDDSVDATPGDGVCADVDGECTLRAAVMEANATEGPVTIGLPGGQTSTLSLAGAGGDEVGDLDVLGDVTIIGGAGAIIDADGIDRAFDVAPAPVAVAAVDGPRLVLIGLSVINGAPAEGENGGAIRNAGVLELRNVSLVENAVIGTNASGGALLNAGQATITDSLIQGNFAPRAGGGIEAIAGSTTELVDTDLISNTTGATPGNGGGYHITGAGTTSITGGLIEGNDAALEGGGVWNSFSGAMTLDDVVIRGNVAKGNGPANGGGGVFQQGPPTIESVIPAGAGITITGGLIAGNEATGSSASGGGILNVKGRVEVTGTRIEGNSAPRAGGGIESTNQLNGADTDQRPATTVLTNVELIDNVTAGNPGQTPPAPGNGGGFHLTGAGTTTISGGLIQGNVAGNEGGGVWNSFNGQMAIDGTEIIGNSATNPGAELGEGPTRGGGGVFQQANPTTDQATTGTIEIVDATIRCNDTPGFGGGILVVAGSVTVTGTVLEDNVAPADRGPDAFNVNGSLIVNGIDVPRGAGIPTPRNETFDVVLSWVNETDGAGTFGLGEPGATGTTTLTIDERTNSIAFEVDYTGVTGPFAPAPGFHIHEGGVAENGPVVVLLATGAQLEAEEDQVLSATVTPTFDVSEILDAPEEYYLNLHSTMFPAGAVRGQLPDGGQDEVPGTFFAVTSTDDAVDADPGDGVCADAGGACTLRAAVTEANATEGPVTIGLPGGTVHTLTLGGDGGDAEGDLDITGDVTVVGNGAIINADGIDRAFDVAGAPMGVLAAAAEADDTPRLTLLGLNIINGAPASGESGGAIRNAGILELREVNLVGNTVIGGAASGGGLLNAGQATITDSVIEDNTATRAGGGIESTAGSTTTLVNTELIRNSTGPNPGNGGGFHLTGAGTTSITGGLIEGNVAALEGGGVWNSAPGVMTLDGVAILANAAEGAGQANGGGGVFQQGPATGPASGSLTISGGTIADNTATGAAGSGGGILNVKGNLTVTDTVISGNRAPRAGGGIESTATTGMGDGNPQAASTTLTNVELIGNVAGAFDGVAANPGNGGGFHLTGAGTTDITASLVTGNVASNEGGGLWNSFNGAMTVEDVTITDNDALGVDGMRGGGGVFQQGAPSGQMATGSVTITGSTITGNRAPAGFGGGILVVQGTVTFTGLLADNEAPADRGPDAFNFDGTLTVNGMGVPPGTGIPPAPGELP